MTKSCSRRDFYRGKWNTNPSHTETPKDSPASSLPSDFTLAMIRAEVSRLGYDPDRLSEKEMVALVEQAFFRKTV